MVVFGRPRGTRSVCAFVSFRMLRHASVLASVVAIAALLEGSALSQARSQIVRGYGMTLVLPSGWKARIYKRLGGPPIAKAATFNFPRGDDDAGTDAQKAMRNGDVLLILFRLSSGGSAAGVCALPGRRSRDDQAA